MADACRADFLVIDDIGAESDRYKSGEAIDKLCQILSRREGMFTVVTTNVEPSNWSALLDARVADRLLRKSVVVDMFEVPSFTDFQ